MECIRGSKFAACTCVLAATADAKTQQACSVTQDAVMQVCRVLCANSSLREGEDVQTHL
jgi:hypothetical protein